MKGIRRPHIQRVPLHGLCGAPRRSTSQSSPSTGGSARSSHRTPKTHADTIQDGQKACAKKDAQRHSEFGRTFSIPVTRAETAGRYKYTAAQRKKTNSPHSAFAPDTRDERQISQKRRARKNTTLPGKPSFNRKNNFRARRPPPPATGRNRRRNAPSAAVSSLYLKPPQTSLCRHRFSLPVSFI